MKAGREGERGKDKAGMPRLVLVADRFTEADRAERVVEAVKAGVRWVHLRDHGAETGVFEEAAHVLVHRLRARTPSVQVTINARLETALMLEVGFHTGIRGPSLHEARKHMRPGAVLGFSAHTLEEAQQAVAQGADYLFYSPVFPTTSKPTAPAVGLEALEIACRFVAPVPVFALGGIRPEHEVACLNAGAYGVAVLSGIMDATDPAPAVQAYLTALNPRSQQRDRSSRTHQ